ncbi:uncharacterized protein [Amphiura filiformis]|uniref:uncharacterized protein n=1 Tax=Amphiura filiformis TaxID=82378 RepID=UPI003B212CA8
MPSKEQKKRQARKKRYEEEKAEKQQGLPSCLHRGTNPPGEACPTTCCVACSLENVENQSLTSNQEHASDERSTDCEPVTETLHQATAMTTAELCPPVNDSTVHESADEINVNRRKAYGEYEQNMKPICSMNQLI